MHLTVVSAYIILQYFKVIIITVLAPSDFSALKNFVLAPKHLPRFHCQRPVASEFTRLEPVGLPCLGDNVGGLSQAPFETENDHRTEGSPAGDLGQPTSATIRQGCQRVLKATKGLCCSWRWTFRTFTVTAMSWLCYFCLNDVILLHDCLDIFERAKIARWQHCNADNFRTL